MTKYNKRGEEIVDTKLDAAGKKGGRKVLFIASDKEEDAITLLTKVLIELRQIKLHLASMTEEHIDEKDTRDN